MIITNKYNLPAQFVSMAREEYEYKPKQYSVTSLLKGTREVILQRRYHKQVTADVSEMVWMLFGRALHHILEQHQEGESELKEQYLRMDIGNGYYLSGRSDLYCADTKTITDYKTASVWKVKFQDFDDLRQQLLLYGLLYRDAGFEVENGEGVLFLKDHSKSKARYDKDYPKLPVHKEQFEFSRQDFENIKDFAVDKFQELAIAEDLPDERLPLCTEAERWNTGDSYAVMKKGRKSALRVLDSEEEAEEWIENTGKGDYIEYRSGEDKKCNDYCNVNEFCDYYQKLKKEA